MEEANIGRRVKFAEPVLHVAGKSKYRGGLCPRIHDRENVLFGLIDAGVEPQVAEVEMVAKEYKKLEGAEAKQMVKLMEALEDHDDVQKVSANFDMSEADMAAAG